MKLKTMSLREQVLVFIVAVVLVGGGYGLLRFYPALKALKAINEAVAKTEAHVRTAEIPDLPEDDEDAIIRQIRQADQAMAGLGGSIDTVERRLALPDSQELRLKISDLARTSGVLMLSNQAYVNVNPVTAANVSSAPKRSSRRARRAAAAQPVPVADKNPAILPRSDGLLARMSPGTAFHRPMQQLAMEGDFDSIKQFIAELNRLPWQVTIVRFKLETKLTDPPAGLPQRLSANFILAL